jgi:tRNA threonylcarbamoyl adenosine modification protein (Sua5/YciO/YrdC/YwlC family)
MTQRFVLHPDTPSNGCCARQPGAARRRVIALPTDALCAGLPARRQGRGRPPAQLRGLDDKHLLTLMCRDLSELSVYAQVDNRQYRFLREWTPGPFTFVLPATKEVPRRLWHPSRKTIGLRVPLSPVANGLLDALGAPVLCSSLILPGEDDPLHEADEILERLARRIDAVLDAGGQPFSPTTVVDMTGDTPMVTRMGCGKVDGRIEMSADA